MPNNKRKNKIIKNLKKTNRDLEYELFGPGRAKNKIHKSKKKYSRKNKHK